MENDESPTSEPLEPPVDKQLTTNHDIIPGQKNFGGKKIVIGLIVTFIIVGFGFGVFKLLNKSKPKNTPPQVSASTNKATTPRGLAVSDIPAVTGTKNLNNSSMLVELTYPNGWTSTEKPDSIRLESPQFNYMTAGGTVVAGNFRIYIRKGAREVDSKYIGRGVAIVDSQQLSYTSPLSTQRKTTNLSLFGLDTPTQFAYFLIVGNYNLKKGATLGPNYGKEPETVLVTGGYSGKTLTDDFATNQVALDKYSKTNAYKQAIDIIKSLKLQ